MFGQDAKINGILKRTGFVPYQKQGFHIIEQNGIRYYAITVSIKGKLHSTTIKDFEKAKAAY